MKFSTKKLCRAGTIAALYVALTSIVLPIASSFIQFRPSEALTILPLFFIESIPALFVGCIIANIISGCTILDIFLGSLITLISAILTYLIGKFIKNEPLKIILGGFFPTILNALFLPLIWMVYAGSTIVYGLEFLYLLASQSLAIYALGTILYFVMKKLIIKYPSLFSPNFELIEKSKNLENNEDK